MATDSSSAAASRSYVGHPPLIKCPDCHRHTIVRCRSKKSWSKGEVFYTCPDHNTDGTGCPFFRWEGAYITYLENEAKEKAVVMQGDGVTESLLEKHVDIQTEDATAVRVDLRTLISIGYEIAGLLKCILCMCLVLVVVQLLVVFFNLKK